MPACGICKGPVFLAHLDAGQHIGKTQNDFRDQAGFHPACQDKIRIPALNQTRCQTNGVIARGAGSFWRDDRVGKAQGHASLACWQVGAEVGQEIGTDLERTKPRVVVHGNAVGIRTV